MDPMRRRSGSIAALGLATVLALAACGSDNSSSSSVSVATTAATSSAATTASTAAGQSNAQLCQARDALTTSVQDLSNVDVVKNGTTGVKDALTKVMDNLTAVKAAATDQLQPQVKAFQDSLTALQTAVNNPGAAAIVSALKDVGTTGATLLQALGNLKCS